MGEHVLLASLLPLRLGRECGAPAGRQSGRVLELHHRPGRVGRILVMTPPAPCFLAHGLQLAGGRPGRGFWTGWGWRGYLG